MRNLLLCTFEKFTDNHNHKKKKCFFSYNFSFIFMIIINNCTKIMHSNKLTKIICIAKRINAWKPEDKENIWELSGLLEGDILMPISQRENRNGIRDLALRWQFGIVPVKIDNWFGN